MAFRSVRSTWVWLLAVGGSVAGCFSPSEESGEETDALGSSGEASSAGDASTGDDGEDEDASDGSTSAAAESEGGGDAADLEEACAEYCGLVGDHCEGELAQYSGEAVCEATCAQLSPGTPDDTLGNTLGCRTFHALLAARSPEPHCRHAGPTGDGTCGATCESFCALALDICEGDLAAYPDADACIAACEGYPAEPAYFAEAPDADTFACRMRHLTLAAAQPDVHCPHIGADSPICTD